MSWYQSSDWLRQAREHVHTFLCNYFPKHRCSQESSKELLQKEASKYKITYRLTYIINKLWFRSSHLGVGCPEAEMCFPRDMMLSPQKPIYPWCAWSSKNADPNHFAYQHFHGKTHSEFPLERLLDTFLHHWENGEPVLETAESWAVFEVRIRCSSRGLWRKWMDRGGWKSDRSWGQGDSHRRRRCWERNRRTSMKVKGGIRIPEKRGEEKEFEDLELMSCKHVRTLLIPPVDPCSPLSFLLLTPVFCLPLSLSLFNSSVTWDQPCGFSRLRCSSCGRAALRFVIFLWMVFNFYGGKIPSQAPELFLFHLDLEEPILAIDALGSSLGP